MRKENPKYRWHITDAEKAEIRRLTRAGVRQSEISRRLNITAPSVGKAQRAMGLPTRLPTTPTPESEIVALFEQHVPGKEISRRLRCPANRVWAVMHKFGLQNFNAKTPPENEARFVEALKRREGYIKILARKYRVAFCRAQRLAHEILGTKRFRPGAAKPPLSSDWPQRNHKQGKLSQ